MPRGRRPETVLERTGHVPTIYPPPTFDEGGAEPEAPFDAAAAPAESPISDEERRFRLLVEALGLCDECAAMMRSYLASAGRTFDQVIREVFWDWFGDWNHGGGCPPR